MRRKGCANGQLGKVFVEKREWTIAIVAFMRSSNKSGKNGFSCIVVSMPL